MNCEQARWLEFDTEQARAHAAACTECQEWMADGTALRTLADDVVPVRPWKPGRSWNRPVFAALPAVAAALLVMLVRVPEIAPPPMPAVAVARPVMPLILQPPAAVAPVVARRKPEVADLYLKIETSDPDVIIYWTVEGAEE